MSTPFFCCDEKRRASVLAHATLNGIDFLEVHDGAGVPEAEQQRRLFVHFLKPDNVAAITAGNLRLEGGERTRPVITAAAVDPADPLVLVVEVSEPGDFSIYTLRLVASPDDDRRPDGFDPLLSAVDFTFKIECPTPFDCADDDVCLPEQRATPVIDYLAKDYASFRRLMLDRLSVTMPDWRERNPADMGIALVELLAYVADRLSYRQDALATEAYLGTARRRVSVRRHARLVDYFMHDGCNARAWVQVLLDPAAAPDPGLVLPRVDTSGVEPLPTRFLTRCIESPPLGESALPDLLRLYRPEVFEPCHDTWLGAENNEIRFYTWGDASCCLPEGATRATLRDDATNRLRLRPGDILVFEERRGPRTGVPADADRTHRQAVRLTSVSPAATLTMVEGKETRAPGPIETDPLTDEAIVEIAWAKADALTFPLCISAVTDEAHGEQAIDDISVALGNIVLADHGRTITAEALGAVLSPTLFLAPDAEALSVGCEPAERIAVPARFNPALLERPLTQYSTYDATDGTPAGKIATAHLATARPAAVLAGTAPGNASLPWTAVRDLLSSRPGDRNFLVEVETDLRAALRFGDDTHGKRPDEGTAFRATYRVGNGAQGNVGREALYHFIAAPAVSSAIHAIRNPLPAAGGTEPETIEDVRQRAPSAFRTQERAVTTQDYIDRTNLHPEVQQATASLRWTGSWRTVFITADCREGLDVDAPFESELRRWIEPYRMAGQDLEVDAPRPAPLELVMQVCVEAQYFRTNVQRELLRIFSRHDLDGRRGVFHPDNFSFGQPVYLSRLYAAAQAVDGVESVEILTLKRRGSTGPSVPESGRLTFGRLEIPRLDNDRNFPERGTMELVMKGGK